MSTLRIYLSTQKKVTAPFYLLLLRLCLASSQYSCQSIPHQMPDLNLELQTMHSALLMNHHQVMRKHRWRPCRTKQHGGRKLNEDSRASANFDLMEMTGFWGEEAFDTTLSWE